MSDFSVTRNIVNILNLQELAYIMGFLGPRDKGSFALTCKTMNSLYVTVLEKRVLQILIQTKNLKALERLVKSGVNFGSIDGRDAVCFAISEGKMDAADILLKGVSTDPQNMIGAMAENALKTMEEYRFYCYTKRMQNLIEQMGSELKFDRKPIFAACCAVMEKETIERLLKHPKLNPGADENRALKEAVKWGRLNIVKLLCEDPRVDYRDARAPKSWGPLKAYQKGVHNPITIAMKHRHFGIVKYLLELGVPNTDIWVYSAIPAPNERDTRGLYSFLFEVVKFPIGGSHYNLLCECFQMKN
jgi:hypothetical protein